MHQNKVKKKKQLERLPKSQELGWPSPWSTISSISTNQRGPNDQGPRSGMQVELAVSRRMLRYPQISFDEEKISIRQDRAIYRWLGRRDQDADGS
jgi:hypothetical protein